jgi:transmembrane sensor
MLCKKKYSYEEWMIKLEEGLSEEEQQLFDNLPLRQPKLASEIRKTLKTLRFIKENVSDIPEAILNEVDPLPVKQSLFGSFATGLLATAMACIVAIGAFYFYEANQHSKLTTETVRNDEMPRTKRLEDGSLIRMNSGTRIKIDYSKDLRRVELLEGEANFDVTKDKSRPFVVGIDHFEIRAVGTSFNVKRQSSEINVVVTEGRIELTADQVQINTCNPKKEDKTRQMIGFLENGENAKIRYETQGKTYNYEVNQQDEEEINSELQWREALLTFGGPTLKDLAEEFERKTGIRMILRDPYLDNIHIVGGVFSTNNPYLILNILTKTYDVPWEQIDPMTIAIGESPSKG